MANPKLIITADDYGLNDSVNRGIIDGINAGVVTSAHVMVNMVSESAMKSLITIVNNARNRGQSVGIGLHINTTYGPATIQSPASFKNPFGHMEDWGDGYSYRGINSYVHRTTVLDEMSNEIKAQFSLLSDYLGGPEKIDAVSSHQNIHMWHKPFLLEVLKLAKPYQIAVRSPRRWSTMKELPIPKYYPYGAGKKGTLPLVLTARKYLDALDSLSTTKLLLTPMKPDKLNDLHHTILNENVDVPENNSGHWFGQPSEKAITWFLEELNLLNFARSGYASEIYMHLASSPSKVYDDRRWDYRIKKRYEEFKTITHPQFIQKFEERKAEFDIKHGSYKDVLE